jgi:predicted methyltransferase
MRRILMACFALCVAALPASAQDTHHRHGDPDDHHHGSEHGTGGVDRWLPMLEGDERDRYQKPDHVVGLVAIEPGMTVVDLGAGTGYFMSRLAAAVGPEGRLLALDVDAELVDFMVERAADSGLDQVEARLVAPDDPALEAANADRVLVVNTWHHLPDREVYAGRIAAALRQGGMLVVIEQTMDSPTGPSRSHRLEPEQVIAELEAGGFEARVVPEELPHQYVVIGTMPAGR